MAGGFFCSQCAIMPFYLVNTILLDKEQKALFDPLEISPLPPKLKPLTLAIFTDCYAIQNPETAMSLVFTIPTVFHLSDALKPFGM